MSWIHRDDLVDLIIDSIRNTSYSGVFNGTAPKPVTMAQLCSAVGGVMGRPSWLPVPDFAITTLLGEGAQVSCCDFLQSALAFCTPGELSHVTLVGCALSLGLLCWGRGVRHARRSIWDAVC